MMQQYMNIKKQYEDCILMFRLGDFYEMFFDDAVEASSILDLVLTGRDCGEKNRAPMCGVPYHAVDNYISRLISAGCKVAVCEQLNLNDKGVAERKVTRVVTPGTVMEDSMLDERANNYLAAVYGCSGKAALCWVDITTGDLSVSEFSEKTETELQEALVSLKPAEIICNSQALAYNDKLACIRSEFVPYMRPYEDTAFDPEKAESVITGFFGVHSINVFEIKESALMIGAVGAVLSYLDETQKRRLLNIDGIKLVTNDRYMSLDYNTRRNLELTQTNREQKKKGSLLWLLDKTATGMGARMLRGWITRPLSDAKTIRSRLDAVECFVDDFLLRETLYDKLRGIRDIERICGKIAYGTVMPRDFKALQASLEVLPDIGKTLSYTKSVFCKKVRDEFVGYEELLGLLSRAIADEPPAMLKDGGYIRRGYSDELDELKKLSEDGKGMLSDLELREKQRTGIKTLKIGYNKVFGYYIEVSNSFKNSVPADYIRKQTLTNGERFITEELKVLEERLLSAGEKYNALERKLYADVCEKAVAYIPRLQRIARAVAGADCVLSLSRVSVANGYVKPVINDETGVLEIKAGRHPIIEELMKTENFIANDTYMDNSENRTIILTGPNMAGKSTYMRQIALITVMAHIGCFVPADKAVIPVTDKIFTRVGASDDILFNQSTFMVEMTEAAYILRNATEKSLIIIDELGRGTSSLDGLSIARAVVEFITEKIRAKTIFATHYSELVGLAAVTDGVKNFGMAVKETGNGVVFLRKVLEGGTSKSFGIEVAELAGIDKRVVERAKEISREIESKQK